MHHKAIIMSNKQKKFLIRIIVSLCLFLAAFITDLVIDLSSILNSNGFIIPLIIYLIIYLIIGYDVLLRALRNIRYGQIFDENFLMIIATIGAFAISEYAEGLAVMLFYQVGEFFQDYAVAKSRRSIASLMDIRPDYANLIKDGQEVVVAPEEVTIGDTILVKPGEKIPLDGIIISGNTTVDTKALTGESMPIDLGEGRRVISGTVNLTGSITVRVISEFYDSTVSKILDLVENAEANKSKPEAFITKFARFYTPIVVICAFLLALIPSLITNEPKTWIYRALNFLVVSCPCALVISVPLSFFSGIGAASRQGILIKGSNYLEELNMANCFIFDKTGTLTKGNFAVVDVFPSDKKDEIIRLACIAERNSNHPIAKSIKALYDKPIDSDYELTDIPGMGIIAIGEDIIACGNEKLMKQENIEISKNDGIGTFVYVSLNGKYIGSILIADEIKPNAIELLAYLKNENSKTIMLTGDNDAVASGVATKLGISEYRAGLLPQDKVEEVRKILDAKTKNDSVCFVGDGINDAPVLMSSDIGIAMGALGSDAAIEAADIVLMNDDLTSIKKAKKIAKKTIGIVYQNIVFAIGVKLAVLILSAFGITNMWVAVFADVGVAMIAILNAMRANTRFND